MSTSALTPSATGFRAASRRAGRVILPAVAFAAVWAAVVSCLVFAGLWWREEGWTPRTETVLLTFTAGAALGGAVAMVLAAGIAGHKPASARFAAMFAALFAGTGGGVLFVYALQFRLADPDFWSDFPDPIWIVEFAFTMASAAYVMLVSGLPLLLPHGLAALLLASLWFARRPRG